MGYPSGQREQTVNLPAYAFEGSNPSPTTIGSGSEPAAVQLREEWGFRRAAASRAVPLLRRLSSLLPLGYLIGWAAVIFIVVAVEIRPRWLDDEIGSVLFGVVTLAALAVLGAISVARNCAVRQVSIKRWFWLALSRPLLYAVLPALAFLLLPSLGGMGLMTAIATEESIWEAGGVALEPAAGAEALDRPTDEQAGLAGV